MNISEFVVLGAKGLQTATFSEIRSALIDRYKSLYGSDIDLSTGSADGVFVNDLSLIINNILRVIDLFYSNLDVNTADGVYLDRLCALSNVRRKEATYSNASLIVTNVDTVNITLNNTIFIDKSGEEWQYEGSITLTPGESAEMTVFCKTLGPITAPAGWIYQTLELLNVTVSQDSDANLGSDIETDVQLRARRTQSVGAAGTTVLESLTGSLLNTAGIKDVLIYNNNTSSSTTTKDSTTIPAHSIYTIIRRDAGVTVADSTIGVIIQEKLTPGISSTESSGNYGTSKSYSYSPGSYGSQLVDSSSTTYWKDATPIAPQISITVSVLPFFTTEEFEIIASSLMSYLNNFQLSTNLTKNDIIIQTTLSDPLYQSKPTFIVSDVTLSNSTNPDTYYNYTQYNYIDNGDDTYTLVLT